MLFPSFYIQNRLEGWQAQVLSRAGNATLIRSVIQASSVYSMSTLKISTSICNAMDSMVRKFWWNGKKSGRFMAMKSWKSICQPKERWGLVLKQFSKINQALLSKLGWKVASNEDSWWVKLLQSKYLRGSSFFCLQTEAYGLNDLEKHPLNQRGLKEGLLLQGWRWLEHSALAWSLDPRLTGQNSNSCWE